MPRRKLAVLILLLSSSLFVWWGSLLAYNKPLGMNDFKPLYYPTRCLIHHQDPYNVDAMRAFYISDGGWSASDPAWLLHTLALFNYFPTIFPVIAPLALLPWKAASAIWTILTALGFVLSSILVWNAGAKHAPMLSCCLVAFLLANSQLTLGGANPAGLVVSFCVISVFCFLRERYAAIGALCLAIGLALKPHDAGFIWLYFVLAGGVYRKRGWLTLAIYGMLGLPAVLWVWSVAPHWLPELRHVMAVYGSHGGATDPGIGAGTVRGSDWRVFNHAVAPGMMIDLQTVMSVIHDNPRFYNPATYLLCAPFLLLWIVTTLRSRFSPERAWFALAAVVPFTLLVTYHRTTDAKLLMLTIPACALLWAQGGKIGRSALLLSSAAIVMTADFPLTILEIFAGNPSWSNAGVLRKIELVLMTRQIPLIIFATGIFYLWIYVKRAWPVADLQET